MTWSWGARRAGVAAAMAALPFVFAYRFAQVYRVRAGFPRPAPPNWTPDALGMPYETVSIPTADGVSLPGWFMPADHPTAPGIVLVHGWESARDRALPHAQFLRAAGFHTLAIDIRGHGENAPEELPISVGEFAEDALAAARWLAECDGVTSVGMLGHSMGAAGALVAAAVEPAIGAVVGVSTPASPDRLTRQTFRLAELPIPGLIAWPLAWVTTRVYLRPRRRTVASISAAQAVRTIEAPVLLVHGDEDRAVPVGHLPRLAASRRAARPSAVTRTLVVHEGRHSWLHEFPVFRSTVARFFAESLGGPLPADEAARAAEAVDALRLPEPERHTMIDEQPGGFRSLLLVFRRQAPWTASTETPTQEE